jgi:DNA topoisomerase-1
MKHILSYQLFEKKKFVKPEEPTPTELRKRWEKKRNSIKELQKNITKLRNKVTTDMGSEDEKTRIIATIVRIIDKTGERVGNEQSKLDGHFGITNLRKKHITIRGSSITLNYVGKSGMKHNVTITDSKAASVLKKLMKQPGNEVFVTSDGLSIKAPQVNKYLSDFNITAKDLRGYKCNKLMTEKLRKIKKPKTEAEIKKVFNETLKEVAEIIGHTPGILRKNYLLPEIEKDFYGFKKVQKI